MVRSYILDLNGVDNGYPLPNALQKRGQRVGSLLAVSLGGQGHSTHLVGKGRILAYVEGHNLQIRKTDRQNRVEVVVDGVLPQRLGDTDGIPTGGSFTLYPVGGGDGLYTSGGWRDERMLWKFVDGRLVLRVTFFGERVPVLV